ncbi:MAG: YwiC-like family protein [Acidimicrobiales bacterium]
MTLTGAAEARAGWKSVALPSEHGGWSLTAEPAVLGLLVAWSWSGLGLAGLAMLAFVARTPIKVVLVDRWRGRSLPRTALALRIAVVEIVILALLTFLVATNVSGRTWIPLLIAGPLIGLELWYDVRSRSRRLIPELAGAVGIGSIAAAISLAGGESDSVAAGLWVVVASRSLSAIPFVRVQIRRPKSQVPQVWQSDVAQLAGVALAAAGWLLGLVPLLAVGGIVALVVVQLVSSRLSPQRAVIVGVQQTVFGLVIVALTAAAVLTV